VPKVDQCRFDNPRSGWATARQAAALLGVKVETLYAYASRGLVTSARGERGRPRRYLRDDLLRLKARHDARAGHGAVAAAALRWGEPVLDSALTAIGPDGPRYRGHTAVALARADIPFEAAAELLWADAPLDPRRRWPEVSFAPSAAVLAKLLRPDCARVAPIHLLLAALAAGPPMPPPRSTEMTMSHARSVIPRVAACLGLPLGPAHVKRALASGAVGDIAATALGATGGDAGRAVNRALVVVADHELNVSTFAARVAASADADLHACLLAANATLTGPRHGGMTAQIEALIAEARRPDRAAETVRGRATRGEHVPGFGHPLYRAGDPRTAVLFELAHAIAPREARLRVLDALVDAATGMGFGAPTVDAGLVALANALGMVAGSAICLFAVGRSAGWVAHAIEQGEAGFLLRPRARYVGPA
jgi:citrate synthase